MSSQGKNSNSSNPPPGENFYLHVNQGWLNDPENEIPDEYPRWGGFIKLHDEGLKKQIQLVKELRDRANKNEEESKISAIWEASYQRFDKWSKGEGDYDPVLRELEILDSYLMPNTPLKDRSDLAHRVADYLHYTQVNGIGNVFDFDKGSNLENTNNVVLDLSPCGLSLPSREYYTEENFNEKREYFTQHLKNVVELINNDNNKTYRLEDDFVQNLWDFENELAKYKMKPEQSRRYDEYYTNTDLLNLYQNINELKSVEDKQENYPESERDFKFEEDQIEYLEAFFERLYELFDFRNVLDYNLNKYFTEPNVSNPPPRYQITTYDGDGIRRVLNMVLNPDNFHRYRSYLQYKVVSSFKAFCTKEIDEEYFDFFSRKLSGQVAQKPEEKRSIQIVNSYAGEMMGKVFVSRYFPEQYKVDVKEMINEGLDIMKESISNNDWLTEPTKEKAHAKLSKFNVKIGFPDVWKDYSDFDIKEGDSLYEISKKANKWALKNEFFSKLHSVLDRNEWLMTPQTVNAYFMPTQNEIVFPAAILQPPFYNKVFDTVDFDLSDELDRSGFEDEIDEESYKDELKVAANFGGIIVVILHEITHGYDDKGRKFDGDGNLVNWWDEEDVKLFNAKAENVKYQAEQYLFVDTEDDHKEYRLKPDLTMGESLADLGGLSLSLKALNRSLKSKGASERRIKKNQRVFMKSFANIWKQRSKKDFLINQLTTDPHPPADFRGNLVKNMEEFYNVFDVTEDDPMYLPPAKRVRMW